MNNTLMTARKIVREYASYASYINVAKEPRGAISVVSMVGIDGMSTAMDEIAKIRAACEAAGMEIITWTTLGFTAIDR